MAKVAATPVCFKDTDKVWDWWVAESWIVLIPILFVKTLLHDNSDLIIDTTMFLTEADCAYPLAGKAFRIKKNRWNVIPLLATFQQGGPWPWVFIFLYHKLRNYGEYVLRISCRVDVLLWGSGANMIFISRRIVRHAAKEWHICAYSTTYKFLYRLSTLSTEG